MYKMEGKCRIWWPKHLTLAKPSSTIFLFGWSVSCTPASVDIVVAFACHKGSLSRSQSNLQAVLQDTNRILPVSLQDKSKFSLLGKCDQNVSSNGEKVEASKNGNVVRPNYGGRSCLCHECDGLDENLWPISVESGLWIELVSDACEGSDKGIYRLPTFHHIHWNGQIVLQSDVHVVIYEIPLYGLYHFSLNSGHASDQVKAPVKKPKWIDELHKNQLLLDLDTVILAINSAAAAMRAFEGLMGSQRSAAISSTIFKCPLFIWRVLAISVASVSTILYIIIQLLHKFSSFVQTWIYSASASVFHTMGVNIHIRCCEIFYWPIFLQDDNLRLQSCVEYAEKAALHRHSMWSRLVVDLLLGNLVGLVLLCHAQSASLWILTFASDITNQLLRSGCVWLMGVPAGFKLNTELAGVLGMISLNAIQIWSTLWIFITFLLSYFIKGLALLGILFGLTTPTALIMDTTVLATLHVTTLHSAISLLYSWQIQALAALWRLFRGRKWNSLRQRIDSYEYTVKQHIVGSLLFTPLLLLLPTITVFYIYFTILTTSITLICVLIQVIISLIHSTPYVEIFLWLVKKRRFPSGIWFEILYCQNDSLAFASLSKVSSSSEISKQKEEGGSTRSGILVLILHSNFLRIGQVIFPRYRKVFSGISDFVSASAYGALTGKRTPCTLWTSLPSAMTWMYIPSKEYWVLCYNSVLACMAERTFRNVDDFDVTCLI